jgi:hypothetical protein
MQFDEESRLSRSDMRMIAQAANQRWEIKPEYKNALVRRLTAIIADPNSTTREVTAASRALIAAEAQNQSDEQRDEQIDESRNRFLDIAERLGITTTIEQLPEAGSDGDHSSTGER